MLKKLLQRSLGLLGLFAITSCAEIPAAPASVSYTHLTLPTNREV